MLLDLEGTDGRERGEDDTTFERQSALFALAVSDVVVINIWCHDIGREHGSGKPLIKTVLQVRWPFEMFRVDGCGSGEFETLYTESESEEDGVGVCDSRQVENAIGEIGGGVGAGYVEDLGFDYQAAGISRYFIS